MCGLVGIAGKLEVRDEKVFKHLLVFDTVRGLDSTGVARIKTDGQVQIAKVASHPFDLFGMKKFTDIISAYTSKAFIGHNRAATTGAKNSVNAHPFEFGTITGAHNGTLERTCWKKLEELLEEEYDVDSQALISSIDIFGVEDTINSIEEGRTSATGAWALTWYDAEDDTLNFLRNKHRPLWYTYSKDFKKILWSSEWEILHSAIATATSDYPLNTDKKGNSFFSFPVDQHVKIKMVDLLAGGDEAPHFVVKEIKGKEPAWAVSTTFGTPPFLGGVQTTTDTPLGGTSWRKKPSGDVEVFTVDLPHANPFKDVISEADLAWITKPGCSWCAAPVNGKEEGSTLIKEVDAYLCPTCSGGKANNRAFVSSKDFKVLQEEFVA